MNDETQETIEQQTGREAPFRSRLDDIDLSTLQRRMPNNEQDSSNVRICERCGGKFFKEVMYSQYAGGSTYSSDPGGDKSPISVMPITVLECICGFPSTGLVGGASRAGRTPNVGISEFQKSLEVAREFLLGSKIQQLIEKAVAGMLRPFVTKEEMQELIQKELETLTDHPPAENPPAPPAGKRGR